MPLLVFQSLEDFFQLDVPKTLERLPFFIVVLCIFESTLQLHVAVFNRCNRELHVFGRSFQLFASFRVISHPKEQTLIGLVVQSFWVIITPTVELRKPLFHPSEPAYLLNLLVKLFVPVGPSFMQTRFQHDSLLVEDLDIKHEISLD